MNKKPVWMDKHPCADCGAGYLECAQGATLGLKCCPDCAHPSRWVGAEPYTADEIAEMHVWRSGHE
jgi:hypothetical protein